jgi:tRNA-specific 2-thiouridylase
MLNQKQLRHTLLPLGEFTKPSVRQMARQFGLPVAEQEDSQDLCFLGNGDYRDFLQRFAPETLSPGPILTREGKLIGEHSGLAFYTIGQRKGLGVFAPQPLYVLNKDIEINALIVGEQNARKKRHLMTVRTHWISGTTPEKPIRAQVKIRYKSTDAPALLKPLEQDRLLISFDEPLSDITPGQAAVFYDGQVCLGGGIIQKAMDNEPD